VKSIVIATQAFFHRAQPGAAVFAVGAAGCVFPPQWTGLSAYMSSKAGQAKLVEYLAAEHPDILICSVHPGVVETAMKVKSELEDLPLDTGTCSFKHI
jgi:NAD(P)-dependent dehydrogenase (short-subunit alcohol dehydrogenase family)